MFLIFLSVLLSMKCLRLIFKATSKQKYIFSIDDAFTRRLMVSGLFVKLFHVIISKNMQLPITKINFIKSYDICLLCYYIFYDDLATTALIESFFVVSLTCLRIGKPSRSVVLMCSSLHLL